MRNKVALTVVMFFSAFSLFAAGRGEPVVNEVEDPAGFKESVDINESKPGKYNFYIEAHDKGGNVSLAGPHNIYIDPESDLPIIGITNPRASMRIPGNLNIVGTCVDDDAVDYVELMFNEDETTIVRAEGADFWSYYLDTTGMEDGLHSITAWGVDVNGLPGKKQTVSWHLDRKKPVTTVGSHELGSLVSGKINLRGTVFDGNSIERLDYSVDNGETFESVSIKHNRKERITNFSLPVDTRDFEDGPAVVWFKAKDRQGTSGVYSYLMYVDNTKPDVRVVFPGPEVAVNGIFTVSGYAQDVVGLESLSWTLGKETGDFELTVGNPWWVKTFDIRGQKLKDVELVIRAVDVSGNVTLDKMKIPVDQDADLPVVTLQDPAPAAIFYGNAISMSGLVRDDDGVESILWSLDGGPQTEVPSTGSFQFLIEDVASGAHSIAVQAKDVYGVLGPIVSADKVVVAGHAPKLALSEITSGGTGKAGTGTTDTWRSGMEVHPETNPVLALKVDSGSALKAISWTVGNLATQSVEIKAKGVAGGEFLQAIPLPANIDYGQVALRIEATDIHDRVGVLEDLVRITDLSSARGDPAVVFEDLRIAEDGTVRLDPAYPLTGYLLGATASEARLSRESDIVRLVREGNFLRIEGASSAGTESDIVVEVTTDHGFTYQSRSFTFVNPGSIPVLTLNSPDAILWTRDLSARPSDLSIAGRVESNVPVDTVYWKAFGPAATGPVNEGRIAANDGRFTLELAARDLPFGPLALEFSAVTDGGTGYTSVALYREDPDYVPPEPDPKAKIAPPAVSWVEGGDYYYFVTYEGRLDRFSLLVNEADASYGNSPRSGAVRRGQLNTGVNNAKLTVFETVNDKEKAYSFASKPEKAPPPASIRLASLDGLPWQAGMQAVIPRGGKKGALLVAEVESYYPVAGVLWTIGDRSGLKGAVKKLPDGKQEVSLELPGDLAADRQLASVEVSFKDAEPLRASGEFVLVRPVEGISVNTDEGFRWTGPELLEDGSILMDHQTPLVGFYNGRPVQAVAFESPVEGLSLSVDSERILLSAAKDGRYENLKLVITDVDGWSFTTDAYRFLVDNEAPALALVEELDGKWVQNSVDLAVTASDTNALKPLEYSLDLGRNWMPLASSEETLDLSALEDGVIGVSVRATDEAGRASVISFGIHKDTLAPQAQVIVPVEEARVNGEIRMGIAVMEAGRVVSVEYEADDGSRTPLEPSLFIDLMIGTETYPLTESMKFHFTDASGNMSVLDSFPFIIDQEMDLPVVEVNLPEDNEVITTDFVVSGIIYDDDKPAKVWYQIDDGEEIAVDCENAYSIPIALSTLTDNEHTVTVTAEDVYGVRGKPVTRNFRVSLEEPKASVLSPRFDETGTGVIDLGGVSSDKNGIERVRVSLDNGNTFNDATGTEEWSYRFDSKILRDGTHVVFVRVWDKYGIEGLYSSLINIDNTAPDVSLESPVDGMTTVGPVFVSGQATDSISLDTITLNVRSLEGVEIPEELASITIEPDSILTRDLDFSSLPDGLYNLDVWAVDAAENVTRVSRNIQLAKENQRNFIECLYPLDGEYLNGTFNLYGYLGGTDKANTVSLLINGEAIETAEVTPAGYFRFTLDETKMPSGTHRLSVRSDFGGAETVDSVPRTITYDTAGPWVTVDSLAMGDFAFKRPWLTGRAGYTLSQEDLLALESKETDRETRKAIKEKKLEKVEMSFDNGKTFNEVELGKEWKYRLETQDMTEGMHYMVIRATMVNGETAVTRMLVQIDKTPPVIRLISPETGGRYNQEMEFTALVNDDIELGDVQYVLRSGDKAAYEVPGFIQGLYFDFHFWGGTFWDIGLGLTFFDDNVKLQVQYGQFMESQWAMFTDEPMRYGGHVFGAKLLANIFYLPFSYMLGPDWAWLSASLTLGANYSYFTQTQSGTPQVMSAVLGQIEFPRVTIEDWKMFRTFSLYTEFQLWFLPTDVDVSENQVATIWPQVTVGLRVNVF